MDVIAVAQGSAEAWVEVFFVRKGKLIGREHFFMERAQDDSAGVVIGQFIKQFYGSALTIPPRIVTQHPVEDQGGGDGMAARPARRRGAIAVAPAGNEPATDGDRGRQRPSGSGPAPHQVAGQPGHHPAGEAELEEELSLPLPLRRMECYDISHIQGSNSVGSMVVFEEGQSKRSQYRRFKVKTV